jgi:hypothetical protein
VATCASLDAEALCSARSPAEYEQVRAHRRQAYDCLPTGGGHGQRACDTRASWLGPGGAELWASPPVDRRVGGEHSMTIVHFPAALETAAEVLEFEDGWVLRRGIV